MNSFVKTLHSSEVYHYCCGKQTHYLSLVIESIDTAPD